MVDFARIGEWHIGSERPRNECSDESGVLPKTLKRLEILRAEDVAWKQTIFDLDEKNVKQEEIIQDLTKTRPFDVPVPCKHSRHAMMSDE